MFCATDSSWFPLPAAGARQGELLPPGLANHINSQPALLFPPARSSFNAAPLTWSLRSTGRLSFSSICFIKPGLC